VVRGELTMLRIQGSMLSEVQVWALHDLAVSVDAVKRFFKSKPAVYPVLEAMAQPVVYDKQIVLLIENVIDTDKQVKSSASDELGRIRDSLQRSRNELNRAFARALNKLQKDDMLADIDQSIRNGRRVVAVFAEHKRQVRGMVHGYSDTGKTTFIEPEETIELNNLVVDLEQQERLEVLRILKELTARFASVL
jgi:DNA mismatch repair protein MutS2